MAALSADRITKSKGGSLRRQAYPVAASTTIYAGGMVCIDADGYAIPAADTAGISRVVGVAVAKVDNSAGADGDLKVVVEYDGAFLFATALTQAAVGRDATVSDDQTLSNAATTTNDIIVGRVLEIDGSTAWVNI